MCDNVTCIISVLMSCFFLTLSFFFSALFIIKSYRKMKTVLRVQRTELVCHSKLLFIFSSFKILFLSTLKLKLTVFWQKKKKKFCISNEIVNRVSVCECIYVSLCGCISSDANRHWKWNEKIYGWCLNARKKDAILWLSLRFMYVSAYH